MCVEVPVGFDALQKKADGRCIRDVEGICSTRTAGEEAADTSNAVDDDGAGVARGGEGAGLGVVGEDRPFLGGLVAVIVEVLADVGHKAIGPTNGDVGGAAVLNDHQAWFFILVQHGRTTHLPVRDDTPQLQKAISRIFEGRAVLRAGVHFLGKLPGSGSWCRDRLDCP